MSHSFAKKFVSLACSACRCTALVVAVLLFAVANASAQSGPKKVKFQMDFVPNGLYSGFFYAQAKGYYTAENLDVELIDGKGSALTVEAVANGNIDIGEANSGVAALAIGQGREIISVGMFIGRSTFGFFVPEQSSIKAIKDISDKSLVMTPGTPEALLLPAVFKLANVNFEKDVKKIAVEAAQKLSTYARGVGDAMVTSLPFGNPIVQPLRPSRTLPWTGVGFVLPDYSFLVRRSTLQSDPQMIAAFLRATYGGMADAAAEVDDAVANYVKQRPLVKPEVAKQQWLGFIQYFCSDAMDGKPLGYHSPEDWRTGLETLREYASLAGPIDFSRFYTNTFFEGDKLVSKTACGKSSYTPGMAVKK
jgi:NitT/TauT family transport system substrate-binding protein